MSILQKFFGSSPFGALAEHTKKVHDCVLLLKPLSEALVAGDHPAIVELHHQVSKTEYEADKIKTELRNQISKVFLLSVGRHELLKFLSAQDDVADAAQDYAVVLRLRHTRFLPELREDFMAFVDQVIYVSEMLLNAAEDLAVVAEESFEGEEAQRILDTLDNVSEEEWKADKLQRHFAERYYSMEDQLDPTTLMFYDKYCQNLGKVANCAEKSAKLMRAMIVGQ